MDWITRPQNVVRFNVVPFRWLSGCDLNRFAAFQFALYDVV